MKTTVGRMSDQAASDQGRPRGGRRQRLGRSEEGVTLVETAIVLILILVPLFLGLVYPGLILYYDIELQNAAAAGASYGARSSTGYSNITGMQNAANYEAKNITMATGYPLATYRVCTDSSGSPTNCVTCTSPSSCSWPAAPNSIFVNVTTKATIKLFSNAPITMTGYATMRAQ